MQTQPFLFRPVFLLHAEGFCGLFASCGAYYVFFPHHWAIFACLFLVPDLSLLLYTKEPSAVASVIYNSTHSYVFAAVIGVLAIILKSALLGQISLVWVAHISLDRAFGYGLKYANSFKFTHIQSAADPVLVPNLL